MKYLVTGGAFGSAGAQEAAIYKKANAFCATQGKEVSTVTVDAAPGIPFVRSAGAELHFRCVDKKSQPTH